MDIVAFTLFFLWMAVTASVVVVAFVGGVWSIGRACRAPRLALELALVCTIVAMLAAVSNPAVNWCLFHPSRERVIAAMLADVGQPATVLVEKHGKPHAVAPGGEVEEWRYWPGPWYALLRWEEVVYRVREGQVQGAFVDD